ncbi:MAG: sugar ABC transporter substrate-binding protein [Gammaproteobacteria bacterium]|nr:sugar ABC transporter substrate-binding protein [Gammaproteobacteria bacterium]
MQNILAHVGLYLIFTFSVLGLGCAGSPEQLPPAISAAPSTATDYIIGPGDKLKIFVWRNSEVSAEVPVRPDGKITTPLVEDMQAVGKTSTELARDLEDELVKYLKNPIVTVTVTEFVGTFGEQIRVVGQAAEPKSLSYRDDITLLDVMIEVGGLTEFASGNNAKIIRRSGDKQIALKARLEDLLNKGDISANIAMQPGDTLIIPQSWF